MRISKSFQKMVALCAMTFVLLFSPFFGEQAASANSIALTDTALSLKEIKYSYGGTTKAGFDCSGYVGYVFAQHDIQLSRTAASMYSAGETVAKGDLSVGDLVFFNTTGKGVSHVGIYIGDGSFAHASTSKGVRVDKLNDPYYWGKRYVGAKRIAGTSAIAFK